MFLLNKKSVVWDSVILFLLIGSAVIVSLCTTWLQAHAEAALWLVILLHIIRLVMGIGFVAVLYGSFVEPWILVTTRATVPFPTTTAITIAVMADLHVGPYKGRWWARRVVERIQSLRPDLILLPGDFLFDEESDIRDLEPLRGLRAPLGIFAVVGNHDSGQHLTVHWKHYQTIDRSPELSASLQSMGITVLHNTHKTITTAHGETIAIAGVDDDWMPETDAGKALAGIRDNMPTILLAHNPDSILDVRTRQADLIVSGHTHGGQFRLMPFGPIAVIPNRLGRAYDQGIFTLSPRTTLAITRGCGETLARSRLFAWPEVLLLRTEARAGRVG